MKFSYFFRSLRAKADFDKTEKHGITYTLPKEAIVLESHMHQPPRIHNDDKMKRYLIQCLINNWSSEEDISKLENNVYAKLCQGYNPLVGEMIQSHAIIRFRLVSKLIFLFHSFRSSINIHEVSLIDLILCKQIITFEV